MVCPLNPDKRKLRELESKLQKQKAKLEKEIEELSKIGFACEADAKEAFSRFLKEKQNSIYKIKGGIELCLEKQKRNKRGRPSRDEQIEHKPIYRIKTRVEDPDEKAVITLLIYMVIQKGSSCTQKRKRTSRTGMEGKKL